MSKPFRLGDYLKPEETAVPKLNTERIEYLSLDLIDPDPDNFYSLEGIADLAENIELVGLLDPIRVRPALSVGCADSSPGGGARLPHRDAAAGRAVLRPHRHGRRRHA